MRILRGKAPVIRCLATAMFFAAASGTALADGASSAKSDSVVMWEIYFPWGVVLQGPLLVVALLVRLSERLCANDPRSRHRLSLLEFIGAYAAGCVLAIGFMYAVLPVFNLTVGFPVTILIPATVAFLAPFVGVWLLASVRKHGAATAPSFKAEGKS